MKKLISSFFKFILVTVLLTVIIGGIAVKSISELASENHKLRMQVAELEQATQETHTMLCDLHVEFLPSWNIDFLTYEARMEFPTTGDYCSTYHSGDVLPMLQFEDNYFLSMYVTAQ